MTGREFRAWRRRNGFPVERVATEMGISSSTVYNHERSGAVPRAIALATMALDAGLDPDRKPPADEGERGEIQAAVSA
jgi:transcriptional regulator with XRE-family HTH domain